MCCIYALLKSSKPESPNQPCNRGRRYVSHPVSQPLWAKQTYPSDPSKSSDCGDHPGSTMHPASASIHGEIHNDPCSNSMTGLARLRVAPSVEEVLLAESWAPAQLHSSALGQRMMRHRVAPSWWLGLLASWPVQHCAFAASRFGVPCARCS